MVKRLLAGWKVRIGVTVFLAFCLLALAGPWATAHLLHVNPTALDLDAVNSPPGSDHLLGTTSNGQDVLAQLVSGARESMLAGLVASVLGTSISVLFGVTAGLAGGVVDSVLTAVTNVFLTMPAFALIFVISGYTQGGGPVVIGLIIGLFGWAGGTRALRAQTLSLRGQDFVLAMRMLGESRARLALVEVLPHLTGWISAMFLGGFVGGVLAESGLAFLGISGSGTVSWGTMISDAQAGNALLGGMWWWFAPPGLCIALLGASVSLINFGIDEMSNPRLRNANRALVKRARHRRSAGPATAPAENEAVLLDVRGLTVEYVSDSGAVRACDDVSFTVRRGEILGVAGESGSGKSTLITALTRLERPPAVTTAGEIWFRPQDRVSARRPGPLAEKDLRAPALARPGHRAAERHERAQPGDAARRPVHRRPAGSTTGASSRPEASGVRRNCSAWSG